MRRTEHEEFEKDFGQMSISRFFLDWSQPALQQASRYLIERYRSESGFLDLSDVVAVVPGGRAGRLLSERLFSEVAAAKLSYLPPQVVTVGQLPELLYAPAFPFASLLTQHLAWARALQETDRKTLRHFLAEIPAAAGDPRWVELGMLLQRQHRELAGEGLDFEAVVRHGKRLDGFNEEKRWSALSLVQRRYLALLDGLKLWDRQTARLVAIDNQECTFDKQIVLVATADMSRVLRQMLDQVSEQVTSLVFAPEQQAHRFDVYGCLVPDAWQHVQLNFEDDKISFVDSVADQANAVVQHLGSVQDRYRADQIAIGVPDESAVPQIELALQQAGLKGRWGAGLRLEASRPFRLLRCLVDFLKHGEFRYLAELIRHPDMRLWLRKQHVDSERILRELDTVQNELLPTKPQKRNLVFNQFTQVAELVESIEKLVAKCAQKKTRVPQEWSQPITDFLDAVYGDRVIDVDDSRQRLTLAALDAVRDSLELLEQVPDELSPPVSAYQAILMLLGQVGSLRSAPRPDAAAVEMLGWLELPLDESAVTIVTNFNEGVVPTSIDSDLFLPNHLRTALGLDDNRRMFARDVYATRTLCASKQEIRVLVAQRRADGDPILPSRLLFRAAESRILQRSLRFFDGRVDTVPNPSDTPLPRQRHAFQVPPPPARLPPIERLRVTDFKTYLACPYRFYLRKLAKLRETNDLAIELDAARFGTLLHKVLEEFANCQEHDSSVVDVIRHVLSGILDEQVEASFGKHVLPAVRIQVEQLRLRLETFAKHQARRRQDGWRIYATEARQNGPTTSGVTARLQVDGTPIELSGRIDRIDRHDQTGEFCILDYKSSDRGHSPEKAHQQAGEWVDLQLPLYRHFATSLGLEGTIRLGYAALPKDASKCGFKIAEWTQDDLHAADEVACDVVRNIREQRFWPPAYPPPPFSDELAAICQDHVFDRNLPEIAEVTRG